MDDPKEPMEYLPEIGPPSSPACTSCCRRRADVVHHGRAAVARAVGLLGDHVLMIIIVTQRPLFALLRGAGTSARVTKRFSRSAQPAWSPARAT
jgi:hypothetical protein